ncbi:DUF3153 domain-containing protein [Oscillatoriales cyanobacterium LEGE 11467]|uniref:DUF3153 domain-containing protein n=1 Tax=Zarconia navalis LEGE 11467 TaxID=1828826 RepID=A0A928ZA22_9CYAN|nr:DUF3153 domain-containing protein [Zarconia navalis LEGE 11467]
MEKVHRWLRRVRLLLLVPIALLGLSGCVRYDVGVNFDSQTHGTIVQQIELSERLANLSAGTVQDWLDSIEQRARHLHGKTKRTTDREILVTIPFNNGAELVEKFNGFFNPEEDSSQAGERDGSQLPKLASHLSLKQYNWIFALHDRLSLDLDLRALGTISDGDRVIVTPDSIVDLSFQLNTPWGATRVQADGKKIDLASDTDDRQLAWHLEAGQLNHLEAVFWVPSPIGIGTALIVALVIAGNFLKYRLLPAWGLDRRPRNPRRPQTP